MQEAALGRIEIWSSSFTLAEVFKKKCSGKQSNLPQAYDHNFEDFLLKDFIVLVEVDREIGTYARALLRAFSQQLKKPQDAIHLATAALNNLDEFHTYDGDDILPLNGQVKRQDGGLLHILTPTAPPAQAAGPLFEMPPSTSNESAGG